MQSIMEDLNEENLMLDHAALAKRIKRSLYYDPIKDPEKDTLSFSVTKFAVEGFRNAAPSPVKKLGHRYAARVARDACVSPCSLLLGVIYIERLKNRNSEYLQQISSSDLFLISMMVASKYLYDEGVDEEVFNDEWANSGGLSVAEVNHLEMEFLSAIDWRIYVHPKEFKDVLANAEASIARLNGLSRGWMTYSDLRSMLDCYDVYQHVTQATNYLYKFTGLCLLAYSGLIFATTVSAYVVAGLSRNNLIANTNIVKSNLGTKKMVLSTQALQESENTNGGIEQEAELMTGCTEVIDCLNRREKRTEVVENDTIKLVGFINNLFYVWTSSRIKKCYKKIKKPVQISKQTCDFNSESIMRQIIDHISNNPVLKTSNQHSKSIMEKTTCMNCGNIYKETTILNETQNNLSDQNFCFNTDPIHLNVQKYQLTCNIHAVNITTPAQHILIK